MSVAQIDDRCFDRSDDYDYSNCKLILIREVKAGDDDEAEYEYMGGVQKAERDVWKQFEDLPAGDYFVYVEIDWNGTYEMTDFCVSSYAEHQIYFVRDEKLDHGQLNLLTKAYASCATKFGKHQTFEAQHAPDVHKYS